MKRYNITENTFGAVGVPLISENRLGKYVEYIEVHYEIENLRIQVRDLEKEKLKKKIWVCKECSGSCKIKGEHIIFPIPCPYKFTPNWKEKS